MTYREIFNKLGYFEANPKPTSAELEKHYAEKYYQHASGTYSTSYDEEELKHFHNIAKVACFTNEKFENEKTLLDLGCGEGFFSKSFQNFGWDVTCCDFSEFGIAKHNSELLTNFTAGDIFSTIETYENQKIGFGLINIQNVLEHVIDPVLLLRKIKPLLSEGGVVRIRVPNDYSDFQKSLIARGSTTNTWFNAPEHLSYFCRNGLLNLLDYCGYSVESLQADFPIEIFLANPHSNYWSDRALGKEAHRTRVFCENHLIETDIAKYVRYSEAAGDMGFGRELIAYAKSR